MRPSKRAAKVLRDARALLARRGGWGQGANEQESTSAQVGYAYCAAGAALKAGATPSDMERLVAEVPKKTRDVDMFVGLGRLTHYNDVETREKRDVIALYDRAIAKAEGR